MDVARESGVSTSTVSRALNNYRYVKPSTRNKVLRIAEKLGYVPNQQARSLAGGRSNLIGVLVPNLSNSYISEIIRGIDDELVNSSYNLILYTTHRHQGKESSIVASIANGAADGLLLVVPLLPTTSTYLDELQQRDFPYVLIDQFDMTKKSAMVNTNNLQGAYEATQYLINLGHRRIGFITGMQGLNSTSERLGGYKQALADNAIALENDLIVEGDFGRSGGYEGGQKLMSLPQPPTAIFASNDLSALGLIEAIRGQGLQIPEDLSIIGFDDVPQVSLDYPRLTTVRQPLGEMGRIAVKILLEHIENPVRTMRQITLATQLIVRDSCKPPRDAHAAEGKRR
ncbi:MAG: LacI family transcriptional regulator [Anaerolineae bacterium]|nr:LacI family transcriptional regulator [Anaerolineae bacterium]